MQKAIEADSYKGIDVSHFQGEVDFKKVSDDGYEFVVAKATEGSKHGSNIVDPFFVRNIEESNKHGLQSNAYHYFLGVSENDARAEADLFIENLKKVHLTGYVFIDVEDKRLTEDAEALTRYVNAFLDQLHLNGFNKIGIYSGRSFFQTRLVEKSLKPGILKWIAAYNDKGAGMECDVWQHSSSFTVPGVNGRCDVNTSYTDKIRKPYTYPGHLIKLQKPFMTGEDVKLIQKQVGSNQDGIFGPDTEAAVKSFQKKHGLKIDGIVGPNTWEKLF